jgi:hypothetical protein
MSLIGKNVFVCTVSFFYTGEVVCENDRWLVLDKAAWIADTGRFTPAIATGDFSEIEVFGDKPVHIAMGAIVSLTVVDWPLPTAQK